MALTRSPRKLLETYARIMTDIRKMRDGGITCPLVSLAMACIQAWTWAINLLPHILVGPFRTALVGIQA